MPFAFLDFNSVCQRASLPLCAALQLDDPKCYSRNIDLGSFLMFEPYLIAICMTCIMIYNVKCKYTAVGRKEIVIFFYMYFVDVLLEFLLVSNLLPFSSPVYPYFAAVQVGSINGTFISLLLNGFIGFQWAEDGTKISVWTVRIMTVLYSVTSFLLALFAFLGVSFLRIPVYIMYLLVNPAALLLYVLLQIVLVVRTLPDMWPLGDVFFGVLFFAMAVAAYFVVSIELCRYSSHYIDGMFLGSCLTLLSVMMVYKYWDSITKDDLEFSVGGAPSTWHGKSDPGAAPGASSSYMTLPGGHHGATVSEDVVVAQNKSFFY